MYGDDAAARAAAVPKTLPRIEVSHEVNWAQACKGEAVASCPFEYAAALTEVMLLGVAALRAGQSRKILYDGGGDEHHEHPRGERLSHAGIPRGVVSAVNGER